MADAYATFGKFLLLKRRTQDGLGTLWRAGEMERTGFKRMVWLRRFDQTTLDRVALTGTTATANQLAGVLRATNIVRNAAFGTESGVPYVAWDYAPAQPLDQLLARSVQEEFPVAIDNALLIVEKLAAALAAASAVEVGGEPLIHGFLVPHLVLVGNDGEAQVAGFGIARGLHANLERASLKKVAAPYLAPEVLAGSPASRRSDVYSMGTILYQLLTGAPLPAEPGPRAAALERPNLAFEEGAVPQDVLAILQKTLAERPEDRYASASEFKRELERLLYGGAYSPTTFNLALFMDRLFRTEIEQEDRELEREQGLDVGPYYQAPPAQAAEEPKRGRPNLALVIPIVGGAVIMAAVIAYLLISRPTAAPQVDQEAQNRMIKELVNTQVAQALQEKEAQLRKELEAEKARTDELRKQLEGQKQRGTGGAKQVSPGEQQRLQQELAAREAQQRKKEEELASVKQQQQAELEKARQQQALAEAKPTAPPTPVPAAPTAAPTLAPPVPAVPAPAPTLAAAVPTVATPAREAPMTAGLGTGVREGDVVDSGQLDVQPQPLVEGKVTLSRTMAMSRVPLSGYVILRVLVNEKGGVDEVTVLRGFSPSRVGIDEACVEAVKQNRYRPAMRNGQPVKTWLTVTKQIALQPNR